MKENLKKIIDLKRVAKYLSQAYRAIATWAPFSFLIKKNVDQARNFDPHLQS